jgi:hypothetical protein
VRASRNAATPEANAATPEAGERGSACDGRDRVLRGAADKYRRTGRARGTVAIDLRAGERPSGEQATRRHDEVGNMAGDDDISG